MKTTFHLNHRGTYINGNLVKTNLTSREERQNVARVIKDLLGLSED